MVLTRSQKVKMAAEGNEMLETSHHFDQDLQQEEQLGDQPELSPRVQYFMDNPYNQYMMEIFFKHNPNGLVSHLITQGACFPPGFDRSILDRPLVGNLVDQPIIEIVLHPPPMTSTPIVYLPPISIPQSASNLTISQPPSSSAPLHNSLNYINTSLPPTSTIYGLCPQVT